MKKIYLFLLSFSFSLISFGQNLQWAKSIGGPGHDNVLDIEIDALENVYITGTFDATCDFDPGPGVTTLSPSGFSPAYIAKYDSTGALVWANQITNTSSGWFFDLQIDNSNNLYAMGRFIGSVDVDPGPGIHTLSSSGEGVMLVKYDTNGNLLWADAFVTNGSAIGWRLELIPSGDLIVAGSYSHTIDLDPGAGVFNLVSAGTTQYNTFFARYDASGNLVWGNGLGTPTGSFLSSMTSDLSGNIYLFGRFTGDSMDLDPGTGINTMYGAAGTYSTFYVSKYNSSGAYLWGKKFEGSSAFELSGDFKTDPSSNLYMTGRFTGVIDVDFGAGVSNIDGTDSLGNLFGYNYGMYIVKYDPSGNLSWSKQITGQHQDMGSGIDFDNAGNLYISGATNSLYLDTDPGLGINSIISTGAYTHYFISKFDPAGKLFWTAPFGNSSFMDALNTYSRVKVQPDGDLFYSTGFEGTAEVDPGPGVMNITAAGQTDFFFAKLSQNVCSSGLLEIVSQSDLTCSVNGTAMASLSGAAAPYVYSWNTVPATLGNSLSTDTIGLYSVTVTDANACVYKRDVWIDGPTNLFAFDAEVHLTSDPYYGMPGTGLVSTFDLDAYNDACPLVNGELVFILDTALTFQSSTPAPSSISGDTLRWNFTGLNYSSAHLTPHVIVTSDVDAFASYEYDTLHLEAYILPYAGDADITNNQIIDSSAIIFAFYPVGIKDPTVQELSVYPNPFDAAVVVYFGAVVKNAVIDVYDLQGRKVVALSSSDTDKFNLDLSALDAGLYVLSVNVAGKVLNKKLVKR